MEKGAPMKPRAAKPKPRKPPTMLKKDGSYHYSGEGSRQFWDRINAIKDENEMLRVYGIGCALQNFEELVLSDLRAVEAAERKGTGR
jgi:hypothetical protein